MPTQAAPTLRLGALRRIARALAIAALAIAPPAAADPAPTPPAAVAPIAPIDPAPRFELLDRGDAVEVIAYGVKAARTAILPVRSRLEVPIVEAPKTKRVTPRDATVKLIELDREDIGPVLSVKLGFERADVKALARFAQAIQVGDDLHLLIPRKLPEGDAAPRLPEPTIPAGLIRNPAPAPAAAPSAPTAAPSPTAAPRPSAPTAPPAPAAAPSAPTAAPSPTAPPRPSAPTAAPSPTAPPRPTAPPASISTSVPASVSASAPAVAEVAPVHAPRPDPAPPAAKPDAPAGKRDASPAHPRSAAEALAATAPPAGSPSGAPAAAVDHAAAVPRAAPAAPTAPSASTAPSGARTLAPALASDRDDDWAKISLYAALGLAAAGLGVWFLRRRRLGQPAPNAQIEIIAQRALGGRARIVWLGVGPREMIVAVTAQQVRVLGQWRRSESPAVQPAPPRTEQDAAPVEPRRAAAPVEPRRAAARGSLPPLTPHGPHTPTGTPIAPMTMTTMTAPLPSMHRMPAMPGEKSVSPAVSGLLRLRRTSQMAAVSSPEADVDAEPDGSVDIVADDLWAKEILAATERNRK